MKPFWPFITMPIKKKLPKKIAETFIKEIITFSKAKVKEPKLITDVMSL